MHHREEPAGIDARALLGGQFRQLVFALQLLAQCSLVLGDLALQLLITHRRVHALDITLEWIVSTRILIDPVGLFSSMSLNEKYGVPDRSMIDSMVV